MNLQEAKDLLTKLDRYKGQVMLPFNHPVKDFVILPAAQKEFDAMLKDMTEKHYSLEQAIAPYQNNVSIIVYFDFTESNTSVKHCDIEYFAKSNSLDLASL